MDFFSRSRLIGIFLGVVLATHAAGLPRFPRDPDLTIGRPNPVLDPGNKVSNSEKVRMFSSSKMQPRCSPLGSEIKTDCSGTNLSGIPSEIKNYPFRTSIKNLTWNHYIRYGYDFSLFVDKDIDLSPLPGHQGIPEHLRTSTKIGCTSADTNRLFFTDRQKLKQKITDNAVIPPESSIQDNFSYKTYLDDVLAQYENTLALEIENVGIDLFLDVQPLNNPTLKPEYFDIDPQSRQLSAQCSIYVHSVLSTPTKTTIGVFETEADRLALLVSSKGEKYTTAKNFERFIKSYQIPQLKAMAESLHIAFNELIAAAMAGTCSDEDTLPPLPTLPFSGFIAYEDSSEISDCDNKPVSPKDYQLGINNWLELDLVEAGIIIRADKGLKYDVITDNAFWYFDAKNRMPLIAGPLEKVLIELGTIHTALLVRENIGASGLQLPDAIQAESELRTALSEAKAFLNAFSVYTNELKAKLEILKKSIASKEESLNQ